ncbi:hypothetical protein FOL47_010914, partial [Perkinsus chesapeaki]
MTSPSLPSIIGLVLCAHLATCVAIPKLTTVFKDLKTQKGLEYTPDEEAEHLSRFQEELDMLTEAQSDEELSVLFDETRPAIMQSLVDEINLKQNTWTASVDQGRFKGATIRDAKRLCGTSMEITEPLIQVDYPEEDLKDLPDSFDSRTGFEECRDVIGHVRDQSDCGSCWAFGATEAFNDRVCIKSNGTQTALMSPGDMLACCSLFKLCLAFGCSGGNPLSSWTFLYSQGIVTGGDYVAKDKMTEADGCWPYNFPKCAHHMKSSEYPECAKDPYSTPECVSSCPNTKYQTSFEKDRIYTTKPLPDYFFFSESIKKEIMTNGPVSVMIVGLWMRPVRSKFVLLD